uniref:EF-hand domain-containing family member B n=1 Tax=Jaculus jaculus TaxID=51337 RepID=UPI001E1B13E1|nr:EF-hand domain-containing family member B [Jaculus jaculus]
MCSFVRAGSPRVLQTSLEPVRTPEGTSPLSLEAGLHPERKDDSGDRRIPGGTKSPTELGLGAGLGRDDPRWRESALVGQCEEGVPSPETKSPLGQGLQVGGSQRKTIPRTLMGKGHLADDKISALQGTKALGVPPGRVGSEHECRPARCPCRRTTQPPLGPGCASPLDVHTPGCSESRRGPMAGGGPDGVEALVEKQPVLGLDLRQGSLDKEPTCVVTKPCTEARPPVEVDVGLPAAGEPDEGTRAGPPMDSVIGPPQCQFAQLPEEKKEPEIMKLEMDHPSCIRPIYAGKCFDRMPWWPSAGKLKPIGHRVATCLTEPLPRLITPPEAKKYYNFRYPPPGAERVFYGRASDPQIAPYLTHGIPSKISIPANTLINPQPITAFQQKLKDKKESLYASNQRAPLGKSHDQTPGLPKGLDVLNRTFGSRIIREFSARDIVNPAKSFAEVCEEDKAGHDLYVITHNDYSAGEAKNRKYNPSSFHRFNLYGAPTPHFNDGRTMARSLYWLHELQMKRGAKVVSQRFDDFKEKFQHKLGRDLDPIADTVNVPSDYTFGACFLPEEYGAGDLIHHRLPGECLRGKDRQRAQVSAIRHHLKKFNHENFDTLLAAFRHYDKKGDGMIDKEELQESCEQANLHLDTELLDQLFDYCDVDNDGLINYLEFANFLNWKDKVLLTEDETRVVIKGRKPDCANPAEANAEEMEPILLIKPEDIVLKAPGCSEMTVRTLLRPSDKVSKHYTTTSSEINAVVGAVPSLCHPVCGVPTLRSDIPAPRIRRISDRTNYGEDGNAYSLLHPSIFSQKGVFERDVFKSRSKAEIAGILSNIGLKLSEEEFENVWNLAAGKHHRGEVSVETIRNVLDELKHAERTKCKTAV